MKNKSAITLVALIITIIVLLILATVSISLVINNGLLDKAQHGVDKYSEEEELEQIKLAVASAMLKGNGFLTTENLNSELQDKIDENENVEKVGSVWSYKGFTIEEDGTIEKNSRLLPAEYQQVEYIESTGTQWIDTLFKANNMSTLIGKLQYFSNDFQIFGALNRNLNVDLSMGIYIDKWFYRYGSQSIRTNISPDNLIHIFKISCSGAFLDETKICSVTEENFQNNINTFLFARNTTTGKEAYCRTRMYNFKILINENNIARNFIPCKSITTVTNADGKTVPANTKGLYDLVEGKFYTNQNTSGDDFNAGPNV